MSFEAPWIAKFTLLIHYNSLYLMFMNCIFLQLKICVSLSLAFAKMGQRASLWAAVVICVAVFQDSPARTVKQVSQFGWEIKLW